MKSQKELFDLIAERFKTKLEMNKKLAELLFRSDAAASKWNYGSTLIDYEKLKKIVEHFNLRPDELFHDNPEYVYVRYSPLDMLDLEKYRNYILGLDKLLSDASQIEGSKILFQADDIPIFYFMRYTSLTYFKLYVYAYDMSKVDFTYEEYVKRLETYNLEPIFQSIAFHYENLESTEIWDHGVVDNLLAQIEHFDELEKFTNPDIKNKLLDDLLDLIAKFKELASNGEKASGKRFDFFVKPSPLGRSFMIIQDDELRSVSLKMDIINSITMVSSRVLKDNYHIFKSSRDKSMALGIGSEKDRLKYFKNLTDKILKLRNGIKDIN
ncbi:hypothetical protein [Sphingobacterium cavernae]|uniref:hypothetical protein n=1 Tax=Sphingobacterium cavernae TaxID=2592657 RepID=UPI001230249D|nr:hypothetical protein [Sphingobacterium cavernae]